MSRFVVTVKSFSVKTIEGQRPDTLSTLPLISTGAVPGGGGGVGDGDGPGVELVAALCVTEYAWPAIVTCPVRCASVFAAMVSATAPLAAPDCPDRMVIQLAPLVAVHEQPFSVDTFTERLPPSAPIVSRVRLRSKWQGAAACVSATRASATVSAADRGAGTGLAATLNDTVAGPWPLVVPTATHAESDDTDQVQSRVVATTTEPFPPLGGKGAAGALLTDTSHLLALGALTEVEVWVQAAQSAVKTSAGATKRAREEERLRFTAEARDA